jgi:hypothetical protein
MFSTGDITIVGTYKLSSSAVGNGTNTEAPSSPLPKRQPLFDASVVTTNPV